MESNRSGFSSFRFRDYVTAFELRYKSEDSMALLSREDPAVAKFNHRKLTFIRDYISMISITLIFFGYFAIQYEFDPVKSEDDAYALLAFVSLLTLVLILVEVAEKVVIVRRLSDRKTRKSIKASRLLLWVVKLICLIVHPNPIFFRKKWIDEHVYAGGFVIDFIRRNFNEYLFLFQFTFLLGQLAIGWVQSFDFNNDEAQRIKRAFSIKSTYRFLLRSLYAESKVYAFMIMTLCCWIYFTICIKVIESPTSNYAAFPASARNLRYTSLSLWYVVNTYLFIGFHDIKVITYLGRIFAALLMLSSIFLNAGLFATLYKVLFRDNSALTALKDRIVGRKEFEKKAVGVVSCFFRFVKQKKSGKAEREKVELMRAKRIFSKARSERRRFGSEADIMGAILNWTHTIDLELRVISKKVFG